MKRLYICLFLIVIKFQNSANAQNLEFGGFLGGSMYQGDLSESFDLNMMGGSGGLFLRTPVMKHFSLRAGMGIGKVSADDVYSKDPDKIARNLSFFSIITDGYLVAEYFPLGFNTEKRVKKITPYIFAGAGLFHFNPKTEYKGKIYELHSMATEGQGLPEYPARKPYNRTQLCYPLGAGMRYNLDRHWNIGMEVRINKTFTDYIDDVGGRYANPEYIRLHNGDVAAALSDRSVETRPDPVYRPSIWEYRGNPDSKDWYLFAGITVSYIPRRWSCYKF